MKRLFLLALLIASPMAYGQGTYSKTITYSSVAALNTVPCTPSQGPTAFVNSGDSNAGLYQCTTVNVWSKPGGGGTVGPGTQFVIPLFSNGGGTQIGNSNLSQSSDGTTLTFSGLGGFVLSAAGTGSTQFSSGAFTAGAAGTVKIGANGSNQFSVSLNGNAPLVVPECGGDITCTDPTQPQVAGAHFTSEAQFGTVPGTFTVGNSTTNPGTTLNKLAKITNDGSFVTAIATTNSDTGIAAYVVVATPGGVTPGNVRLLTVGQFNCVFDASVAAAAIGHLVVNSTTAAPDCHDTGSLTSTAGAFEVGVIVAATGSTTATVASTGGGAGGGGTVSSVALALPASTFSISGSPVTSSGTLTGSFINQNANLIFSGPTSGGAAIPTWRSLVKADQVATTAYTDAANVFTQTQTAPSWVTNGAGPGETVYTVNGVFGAAGAGKVGVGAYPGANQPDLAAMTEGAELPVPFSTGYNLPIDTGTGVQAGGLATLTSAGAALATAANTQSGVLGLAVTPGGTSGNVMLKTAGFGVCNFDNTTVIGDYVQPSWTQTSNCTDAGATYPLSGQIIGRVLSVNAGAGTIANMLLYAPDMRATQKGLVNITPVTASNPTINIDTNLQAITIPANAINAIGNNLEIWYAGIYSTSAATSPVLTFKLKACQVSGCASGIVVTLATWITTATSATACVNCSWDGVVELSTVTTGASGTLEVHGNMNVDVGLVGAATSGFTDANSAVSAATDLTKQEFLTLTIAQSVAGALNVYTQRQTSAKVFN